MGFGRTALGRSFVYHAGTAVDSMGDTCGSRGGMVSWPRSWHTPCRAWYWCQATRSLRSTRIVRWMWSHRDCGMRSLKELRVRYGQILNQSMCFPNHSDRTGSNTLFLDMMKRSI